MVFFGGSQAFTTSMQELVCSHCEACGNAAAFELGTHRFCEAVHCMSLLLQSGLHAKCRYADIGKALAGCSMETVSLRKCSEDVHGDRASACTRRAVLLSIMRFSA